MSVFIYSRIEYMAQLKKIPIVIYISLSGIKGIVVISPNHSMSVQGLD